MVGDAAPSRAAYLLDEEFSRLDAALWRKKWWWKGDTYYHSPSGEAQAYRTYNATVSSGVLSLTARREDVTDFRGRPRSYTSGIIQSNGMQGRIPSGFEFTYGRVEARVKIPKGQGLWPALWLCNSNYSANCSREIDVFEAIGREPRIANFNVHWHDLGIHQGSYWTAPNDFGDDYHVYSVDWRPTYIAWYVDGIERYRYTGMGIPSNPHYIILNLAVGEADSWPGAPSASTLFPASMEVDWVRVSP